MRACDRPVLVVVGVVRLCPCGGRRNHYYKEAKEEKSSSTVQTLKCHLTVACASRIPSSPGQWRLSSVDPGVVAVGGMSTSSNFASIDDVLTGTSKSEIVISCTSIPHLSLSSECSRCIQDCDQVET